MQQVTFASVFFPLLIISVLIFIVSLVLLIAKRKKIGKSNKVVLMILLIISSIPILFSIVLVIGFYNQKPHDIAEVYEMPKNEEIEAIQQQRQIISNDVSMTVHAVSPVNISFSLKNTSDKEFIYGEDFTLYVRRGNSWEAVKPINENIVFEAIGYTLLPYSTTDIITANWRLLYGELDPDEYRFEKRIIFSRSPGDYDFFFVPLDFRFK